MNSLQPHKSWAIQLYWLPCLNRGLQFSFLWKGNQRVSIFPPWLTTTSKLGRPAAEITLHYFHDIFLNIHQDLDTPPLYSYTTSPVLGVKVLLTSILPLDSPSGTIRAVRQLQAAKTNLQTIFHFCGNAELQQVHPSPWVSETSIAFWGQKRHLHR